MEPFLRGLPVAWYPQPYLQKFKIIPHGQDPPEKAGILEVLEVSSHA